MSKITVTLTPEEIDLCFKDVKQHEYLVNLYKLVFENAGYDWSKIKKLSGFPKINKESSTYIYNKCFDFDKTHNPGVMPGGAWFNSGFATDETLGENEIVIDEDIIFAKEV